MGIEIAGYLFDERSLILLISTVKEFQNFDKFIGKLLIIICFCPPTPPGQTFRLFDRKLFTDCVGIVGPFYMEYKYKKDWKSMLKTGVPPFSKTMPAQYTMILKTVFPSFTGTFDAIKNSLYC